MARCPVVIGAETVFVFVNSWRCARSNISWGGPGYLKNTLSTSNSNAMVDRLCASNTNPMLVHHSHLPFSRRNVVNVDVDPSAKMFSKTADTNTSPCTERHGRDTGQTTPSARTCGCTYYDTTKSKSIYYSSAVCFVIPCRYVPGGLI